MTLNINTLTLEASYELKQLLILKNIDVALIQETVIDQFPEIPGYQIINQTRLTKGGGTAILFKTDTIKLIHSHF